MYVPPSGLISMQKSAALSSFNKRFQNTPLRVGIITECFELDDVNNVSQLTPEYTVVTNEQESSGGSASKFKTYKNCISADGFGGIADFFEYKLRPTEKVFDKKESDKKTSHDFTKQNGSTVLILCLDGFSEKAIIIGGIPNLTTENPRQSTLTKDNGLHLEGEYNGVNWQINKEGEFTLTFRSKTDNDGKVADEKAGGTFAKINKEGSVDINTNLEGNDETYIRMDKKNKDVGIKAGANIGFTAKKDVATNAEGKITGKAKSDIEFAAEGSAKYTSKSAFDIKSDAAVNIKGANIMAESDGSFSIKASEVSVEAPTIQLGSGGSPAVVPTTMFCGTGNKGAPVISMAVGPFSSVVMIAP